MRYLEYREQRTHHTQGFPFAYYHITSAHPRYNMVYHWHPEYELVRVIEGSLQMRLDSTTITAEAGDVLLITDGMLHGGMPENCIYECIVFDMQTMFPPALCDEDMRRILQHKRTLRSLFTKEMSPYRHAVKMFEAMKQRTKGYHYQVLGALHQFLGEVIQNEMYEPQVFKESKSRKEMVRMKDVLEMIRSNYPDALTLQTIAECAKMNEKYFCRYFRSITGRTPMDYLNYYRIECACEQLTLSTKSIMQVGLDSGFGDGSYFVKVFKRYKAMTPSQYIRQFRLE